jgi:hypothetical protein
MTNAAQEEELNLAELSDDEFMEEMAKHQASLGDASNEDSEPGVPADESQASAPEREGEENAEDTGGADPAEPASKPEGGGEASSSEESGSDEGNDEPDKGKQGVRADPHQGDATSDPDPKSESDSTPEGGTEAGQQLAQLMAPLKAAKRTIEIDSVDKARQLMQMGVDYSRKMADLKPYQRMMTSLERADLLDEEKLNFLIDLANKRPEAIQKLLKDSEIDPLDLDLEDGGSYRPNDHMVSESELAIDEALDSIRPSPKFNDVVTTIQAWDTASKKQLMDNPQAIQHLAAHMETGIYDKILDRLESDRIFGKHVGLSDLDAYKAVGDAMFENGEFAQETPNSPTPSAGSPTDQGSSQDSKGSSDSDLKGRKRAASTPKGGAGKAPKKTPDFSQMSDEEIANYDWRSALT